MWYIHAVEYNSAVKKKQSPHGSFYVSPLEGRRGGEFSLMSQYTKDGKTHCMPTFNQGGLRDPLSLVLSFPEPPKHTNSIFFKITCIYFIGGGWTCRGVHVRLENSLWESALSFHHVGSGVELKSSGLAASAFTL